MPFKVVFEQGDGKPARVVVKKVTRWSDDGFPERHKRVIEALHREGVTTPILGMYEHEGEWVQVSHFIGSQKGRTRMFDAEHRELTPVQKSRIIEEMAKIANAGYATPLNAMKVYGGKKGKVGVVDIDYIGTQGVSSEWNKADAIIEAIAKFSSNLGVREKLFEAARKTANKKLKDALTGHYDFYKQGDHRLF